MGQSAIIADMEYELQLHQDHIKILKAKRWNVEKFEKQLAHSESLIGEYTTASAMLIEQEREKIHTN